MIPRPIDQIELSDLLALIEREIPEGRQLDYKGTLDMATDEDKKDLLGHIASFANTSGGDMVFGMIERRDSQNTQMGIPARAAGLDIQNPDVTLLSLVNLIRDGIAPQITGIQHQFVDGQDGKPLIVIRIPSSYSAPHMVTKKMRPAFYGRTAGGRFPMDIQSIRAAFAISQAAYDRIRDFRAERLRKMNDPHPAMLRMASGARLILIVYPLSATVPGHTIDLRAVETQRDFTKPLYNRGLQQRFNADGFVTYCLGGSNDDCRSYFQVYRNGVIETADTDLLEPGPNGKDIHQVAIEMEIIDAATRALALLRRVGVSPPVVLMASLQNVLDYALVRGNVRHRDQLSLIDRNSVDLPEVIVQDKNADMGQVLRPVFDALYQAAGMSHCPHYDKGGLFRKPDWSTYEVLSP